MASSPTMRSIIYLVVLLSLVPVVMLSMSFLDGRVPEKLEIWIVCLICLIFGMGLESLLGMIPLPNPNAPTPLAKEKSLGHKSVTVTPRPNKRDQRTPKAK